MTVSFVGCAFVPRAGSCDEDPDSAVFGDDSGTIEFGNGDTATFENVESFNR